MKVVLLTIFCSFFLNATSQDSGKVISVKLDKENTFTIKFPPEEQSIDWKSYLPILAIFVSLIAVSYQISARRKDDRIKNQLDRLNKQITEFYGPLYSLYETGHRNYYNYLKHFGKDVTFKNPNFKVWVYTVFQPTNIGIENIIINKADLILSGEVPEFFLQFCKWSATIKVYIQAQLQDNFDSDKWQTILDANPHPEVRLQMYLRAGFEVLKEEQNNLLSGDRDYINEADLIEKITKRKEKYIAISKDPNTPENLDWQEILKRADILDMPITSTQKTNLRKYFPVAGVTVLLAGLVYKAFWHRK